ncbi:MAG: indolepyruvate oxidoreductase subunit beta [Dehalococcoidia bacterium]|nr:indolepyruvate oxidoreductase subunit beta [Dehalococcoidia bacterium]
MTKNKDPLNIIITGVGGQGNVLLSQFVGKALVREGYHATIGETYGASQRGGAVMSHLRVSRDTQYGPLIAQGQADIVLGLEPLETMRVLSQYGNSEVVVITNSRPIFPVAVTTGEGVYPSPEQIQSTLEALSSKCWVVDATEIALEMGAPILANIIMMGALVGAGLLPIGAAAFEAELRDSFAGERLETNLAAFRRGMSLTAS